jgi:hypothetical protein
VDRQVVQPPRRQMVACLGLLRPFGRSHGFAGVWETTMMVLRLPPHNVRPGGTDLPGKSPYSHGLSGPPPSEQRARPTQPPTSSRGISIGPTVRGGSATREPRDCRRAREIACCKTAHIWGSPFRWEPNIWGKLEPGRMLVVERCPSGLGILQRPLSA